MSSIQSRLLFFAIRNRNLLKFNLKKETWDWNTSIPRFREECEEGALKGGPLPDGIGVSPVSITGLPEGLKAEWILPPQAAPEPAKGEQVLFYTHGGGYVSGSCSDHRGFVAKIVKASGVRALLYEYRLAPEHPFPAAMDDTLTAYRWLLAQGVSPADIIIVGESAGGGLCLATLLALKDQAIPMPRAAVALSPWTDLKLAGKTKLPKGSIDPEGMAMVCSKYYAGENDPALPWISPVYGDLHGLPPLLIYVGDAEGGLQDSVRFNEKAKAAGVDVILHVGEGMVHCYPLFAPLFPEATQAMAEICSFIHMHAGQKVETAIRQD